MPRYQLSVIYEVSDQRQAISVAEKALDYMEGLDRVILDHKIEVDVSERGEGIPDWDLIEH
jgi:hypothetical protein